MRMQAETYVRHPESTEKKQAPAFRCETAPAIIHPLPGNGIVEMMFETVQGKAQDSR